MELFFQEIGVPLDDPANLPPMAPPDGAVISPLDPLN